MAKRGFQRQINLPFEADLVEEIFLLWQPELIKWHEFQDTPTDYGSSQGGNCFDWWRSRYSEWIQTKRSGWTFEIYSRNDKLFPRIWERYEETIRRGAPRGVPNRALEN